MLRKPRLVDRKARGVGIQALNVDEKRTKKEFVGAQYEGRPEAKIGDEGDSEDIVRGFRGLIETVSAQDPEPYRKTGSRLRRGAIQARGELVHYRCGGCS